MASISTGCTPKAYERHIEVAYTQDGQPRAGYIAINIEFMDALNDDLQACYTHKR